MVKTTMVERTSLIEETRQSSVLPKMEEQRRPTDFSIHEVKE